MTQSHIYLIAGGAIVAVVIAWIISASLRRRRGAQVLSPRPCPACGAPGGLAPLVEEKPVRSTGQTIALIAVIVLVIAPFTLGLGLLLLPVMLIDGGKRRVVSYHCRCGAVAR